MTRPGDSTAGSRSEALADLRRAVSVLSAFVDTPSHRVELAVIEEALARLSAEPNPFAAEIGEFDTSRLTHLLDLTGPDLAQELLARLTEDLDAVLHSVEQGTASADWKRLREATHVLISLSGSVGALSLQAMAEELNALAHQQDLAASRTILSPLTRELRALIAYVRATKSQGNPGT
ncbi:MAG: Hpt domain-containing protein [Tabrizicola sp.]|nr:Hpt domain-containing protein [Tabrizicola sp.]